ncbi:MAG TPA: glutamate--cysteine ligase [Desulfopila sp.]|nr:glutamate--cysteine ligase [Desulfopila sp.]
MDALPIESEFDLVAHLESGSKTREEWRIGTEHEKFGFNLDDLSPLRFDGDSGIAALLKGLCSRFLWKPVEEDGKIIALKSEMGAITLEPGGQIELSGAPLENLHQTCDEVHVHLHQVKTIAEPMGVGFLGMGFTPLWSREQMEWMPKERYRIMRRQMPKVGSLGIDMMLRTATVQVNLDFNGEADMVQKFRVSLALQPLATALFANSPFCQGKPNGFLSYRSSVWRHTDPSRCGMLPFVFEDGMGFERYVQYMLDVPMYFVQRQGRMIDAAGQSFRDFLAGRLPALPGEVPTIVDWEDHLTTAFPEVRLKQYLEMRGADGGNWNNLCALPAFWVGLLYDNDCLDAAWELVRRWSAEQRLQLRHDAPRLGLKAKTPSTTLQELALEVLAIAEQGLKRRGRCNADGDDETHFLERLWQIATSGVTPAEEKLACYHGDWQGSVEPIFRQCAY